MNFNPKATSTKTTLTIALFLVLLGNYSFWKNVIDVFDDFTFHNSLFLFSIFILLAAYLNIIFSLVSIKYIFKPVIISILIVSSFSAYFMDSYGVMIDKTMMRNVLETDVTESYELLNFKMLYYFVIIGLLPSLIIIRTNIIYKPFLRESITRIGIILLSFAIFASCAFIFYKDYASLARNNRHLRHLINPTNFLNAIHSIIKSHMDSGDTILKPVGMDATLAKTWQQRGKKTLTILVLGETARARNFSLNGYKRDTNPMLAREDIINFSNVYSCGTATASSLPCMFSHLGRRSFSVKKARGYESVLDVLSHAGISVLWRDNNSGCKGTCDRVQSENMVNLNVKKFCSTGECHDEILLYRLQAFIDKLQTDAFIVLHQKGSHGPAYYLRYPEKFKKFTPICETNQLQDCKRNEIVNTYDNTILYTDYFISRVISLLKKNTKQFNTAMLYISDHGESLGERNIYLHGMPYLIAPKVQKHIPFVLWFSREFETNLGIDKACLQQKSNEKFSHDNLFHSALGLMDVRTDVYNKKLDIFSNCRKTL
ncbi:MAG TPA: phosphoethanolamine--lipid A transferase [Gammaproteobacteria bacterium]|nr:phosphoethanolamine--lipid A transferase [Gammaproteobacteria bacterium]